ncbi:MAG: hypothetical protein ABIE43_04300 [Patescibacteria group bacterium]
MKSKRLLILVIILIAVIALAGVLWYVNRPANNQLEPGKVDNNQPQGPQSPPEQKRPEENKQNGDEIDISQIKTGTLADMGIEEMNTSDWKTCVNENLGFKIKYPEKWGDCYTTQTKVRELLTKSNKDYCVNDECFIFKTDYKEHDVYSLINITSVDKNETLLIQNIKKGRGDIGVPFKDGVIFNFGCSGSPCIEALLENEFYKIDLSIDSNQLAPDYYDGIWSPDHNITRDIDWNILTTLEVIN